MFDLLSLSKTVVGWLPLERDSHLAKATVLSLDTPGIVLC